MLHSTGFDSKRGAKSDTWNLSFSESGTIELTCMMERMSTKSFFFIKNL